MNPTIRSGIYIYYYLLIYVFMNPTIYVPLLTIYPNLLTLNLLAYRFID